ncbi:MAG: DUF3466 family protein [Planctomycetota bacterium]|nr:DUF3466 family protein [Planctomycetota bacterium]
MARSTRRASRAVFKASFTCAAALSAAAGLGALGGTSARAEHIQYEITHLGYFDEAHTNGNNPQNTFAVPEPMNPSGSVIGHTTRFEGQDAEGNVIASGQTAWLYHEGTQVRIGLVTAGADDQSLYVQPGTNNQSSTVQFLNNSGVVAGNSTRYKNATEEDGTSVWIQRPGGDAERIGNFSTDHSRGTFESSTLVALNNGSAPGTPGGDPGLAQAVGTATRYVGEGGVNDGGQSAWFYDGTTTNQIGLFNDGEHGDDEFQSNNVLALNDNGVSAGTAARFEAGGASDGTSAWINDASGSAKIGFFEGTDNSPNSIDYTQDATGVRESSVVGLNQRDEVVGLSLRYRGETFAGLSAWIHKGGSSGSSVPLGLTGSDHTKNDSSASDNGYQSSGITAINDGTEDSDGGFVLGTSERFANGATNKGQSAWVYDGANSDEVGLLDGAHQTNETNKRRFSAGSHLNAIGHAAGFSHRYNQSTNAQIGQSAWVYNGTEPFQAGLVNDDDSSNGDFVRDDTKEQFSTVTALNDIGDAVGQSRRYVNSTVRGQGAWFYDDVTHESTRIGLFDEASFTRSDNKLQNSTVLFLNDAGQAVGTSSRFNGTSAQEGQTAWFYDSALDLMTELKITTSAANAGMRWELAFLSDSGDVLGTYRENSANADTARAFLWDYAVLDNLATAADERFHDLGDWVEGGLTAAGWESLHSALEMSDLGHIRGFGTLAGTTYDMPYLLTPVPEPTGIALLAMSGLALLPRRRRR